MILISNLFTVLTCLLHGFFLILEMFFWTKPFGLKIFKMSKEKAHDSKVLAANQGLYNGLLALGLLFSFIIPDTTTALAIRTYCLVFIVIVGLYGWYTLKNIKVFLIQSLPALIALIFAYLSL